jgi:hypothetical protein
MASAARTFDIIKSRNISTINIGAITGATNVASTSHNAPELDEWVGEYSSELMIDMSMFMMARANKLRRSRPREES